MSRYRNYGEIAEAANVNICAVPLLHITHKTDTQDSVEEEIEYTSEIFSWERIYDKVYNTVKSVDGKDRFR